jgi:uncharacterized protein (TIGR02246 family)
VTPVAVSQLSAEDRALIDDLFARYNRSIDTGDKEEFVNLYTEDGVWVSPMEGTFEGREALGAWIDEFYARDSPYHQGQHRVTNVIFDSVEPGRCEVWCNWTFVASKDGGPRLTVMGNYIDVLVKEDDRWLFEKRTIEIIANNQP